MTSCAPAATALARAPGSRRTSSPRTRSCTAWAGRTASRRGRGGRSREGCTASRWAGCSPGSRCSTGSAAHPRWPLPPARSGCGTAGSGSSTYRCSRRTCRCSAAARSRVPSTAPASARPCTSQPASADPGTPYSTRANPVGMGNCVGCPRIYCYTACMRFGIDFGTTHTVVAVVDRGNYPIVSFEHTDAIPSIVSVDPEGEVHFGRSEAGWTVLRSFKRLLDEGHPEAEVRIGNRPFTLADLLTRFLAHVREQLFHHSNAGLRKKDKIETAVSVPANASTAQRLITMDAYRRAGFDVKAVLNEPSAAGFEYAHRFRETVTSKREYVLVYDLGGGTFDASLIHMEGKSNEVITSSGVSRLGGDDFDLAIAKMLAAKSGGPITPELLDEVRTQKESLSPNTRRFAAGETAVPI